VTFKWFTPEKDPLMVGLAPELMSKLDTAREVAGIPFFITSGLRSCAANAAAMGADRSAHIRGLAVDLGLGHLVEGGERDGARFRMVQALLSAGFVRIFLYQAHLHVDVGAPPDYVQGVIGLCYD
jgi:uncharacterized protein YcbK (DUF882 family)